jgi:hypothetical protein
VFFTVVFIQTHKYWQETFNEYQLQLTFQRHEVTRNNNMLAQASALISASSSNTIIFTPFLTYDEWNKSNEN